MAFPGMQYPTYGGVPLSSMGLSPLTAGLLPPGPQSPAAQRLFDASDAVMGDPAQLPGALSSARSKYDAAVQDKMAAINRAMDMLSGTQNGQSNTPLMAAAAGLLSPTRGGTIGESIGNAFSSALPQIQQQREMQRSLAQAIGNLGIEGAQTGIEGATGDQAALDKRLQISEQMENAGATAQNRADMNAVRQRAAEMQYAGRVSAAQIGADKNRYKQGPNTQDGKNSIIFDTQTGQQLLGDPVAPGANDPAARAQWMQNAWLRVHQGDYAGALDYVAGHKTLTDQEIRRSAYTDAERELGVGADKADIDNRAAEISGSIKGGGMAAPAAPAPGSPAPKVTPAVADGKTNATPSRPITQDDFNKLPSGSWFVNPKDGRVMKKQ